MGDALVFDRREGLVLHQPRHAVGQLDLAARAARLVFQDAEDFGLQDVAARDRQVRRRLAARRLLDHPLHADVAAVPVFGVDDAVFVGLALRHRLDADDIAADLGIDISQLFQGAWLGIHDHIGQQDRERLIADDVAGAPDGVAQTQRLHLAGEAHLAGRRQLGDHGLEDVGLALGQQLGFQLDLVVEIVLDRALGPPGDEDDMLDSGLPGFLDDVAEDGPVDDVQQFLGRGLGAGQDAGAQTGDGQDSLAKAAGGGGHGRS